MLKSLRRRGWVVVATTAIVVACALAVVALRSHSYTAEGVAVVAASNQLTPDQANRLAITDAILIRKDSSVASHAATLIGTTARDVQHRLSVFNPLDTALLQIDYRGTSPFNARLGATAVLLAVSGAAPASANIAPLSIRPVAFPDHVSGSTATSTVVAVAAILGIALGVLLLVTLERTDPRIDSLDDLEGELGVPASSLEAISDTGAAALIARWQSLAGHADARVAVLPVSKKTRKRLPAVVAKLERWWGADRNVAPTDSTGEPVAPARDGDDRVRLVLGTVPEGGGDGEATAMEADVSVLVVQTGARRAALRAVVNALSKFGVTPAWAILVSSGESAVQPKGEHVAQSRVSPPTTAGRNGAPVKEEATSNR